jgi:sugar O-acyltransferase (sialic acid O-acetyltransferase NeuD family)
MKEDKMILIGYSGHAFVVCSIFNSIKKNIFAYCDNNLKEINPFNLEYLGTETSENGLSALAKANFFIAIGDNKTRRKVYENLSSKNLFPINAIHSSAIVCSTAYIAENGVMISAGVIVNPLAKIGTGAICNTGCIIEHECVIGDFVHVAPGAVLCGNVTIGENTFVGAGSVIKQGVVIGKNVTIGAGSVVVKNIEDNSVVYGNPAQIK